MYFALQAQFTQKQFLHFEQVPLTRNTVEGKKNNTSMVHTPTIEDNMEKGRYLKFLADTLLFLAF